MAQFTTLTSRIVPLPVDDVDTDQIIPARFLKTTDKKGLGKALFSDWRYGPDGAPVGTLADVFTTPAHAILEIEREGMALTLHIRLVER